MSRLISALMRLASKDPITSPVIMTQIGFAFGPVYLWSGYGTVIWDGKTFVGSGTLGKVEPATDTSDLSAQGAVFTMEGVSLSALSLALGQVQQGLPAKMWLGMMDTTNAVISSPTLIFSGLTDVCKIDEGDTTTTISITCENKLARLSTPSTRRFTSDDQALDYPGDQGFVYVPSLQDAAILFG